jgi:hypothetical protein
MHETKIYEKASKILFAVISDRSILIVFQPRCKKFPE